MMHDTSDRSCAAILTAHLDLKFSPFHRSTHYQQLSISTRPECPASPAASQYTAVHRAATRSKLERTPRAGASARLWTDQSEQKLRCRKTTISCRILRQRVHVYMICQRVSMVPVRTCSSVRARMLCSSCSTALDETRARRHAACDSNSACARQRSRKHLAAS